MPRTLLARPAAAAGRGPLALAGATALLALLTACGGTAPGGSADDEAGADGGGWEFTDDRGETISLPERPENVVMQVNAAAALVDFGVDPAAVFGPRTLGDGSPSPQAGDVPADTPSVGTEFGEFDMEAYLAAEPDLVVTIMYGETLWYLPEEGIEEIEETAPIVAVQLAGVPADEAVEKFADLAGSLGADLDSAELAEAREQFEAAGDALAEAAEAQPDLSTLVVQGTPDTLYIAKPEFYSDLAYFQAKGVDIVVPDGGEGPNWEELSWERASTYDADLILTDDREIALPQDDLADIPTWTELPAVQEEQLGLWHAETPMSYQKLTPVVTELAETIEGADPDVA
ncbi:ABC transporter substrate-binding protein [Nocardiopsis sediminis]|uniref:ABC transporter substrate-binding protein n=1 Tax=Nocardiopsis sediminis TaxID=1778267 RepID=A0ABV8FV82_9ACTN